MNEHLPACDHWHPDTPSRITTHKAGFNHRGEPVIRKVCLECQRVKVAESRWKGARGKPYGVIPLNWPVPQL